MTTFRTLLLAVIAAELPRALAGGARMPTAVQAKLAADKQLEMVFENNLRWRRNMLVTDPEYFSRLASGQNPQILWIGCSDSRVPANSIMGLDTGEVFVARNVANVVSNMDNSMMSVLQYAVNALKVPHIVVCGHYYCGGVAASTENADHDAPLEQWLRNVRDVSRIHADELRAITDKDKRLRRLVELNVIEQCLNLFKTGVVQQRRVETYKNPDHPFTLPRIHACVYDPSDGILRQLNVDFTRALRELGDVYNLYKPA